MADPAGIRTECEVVVDASDIDHARDDRISVFRLLDKSLNNFKVLANLINHLFSYVRVLRNQCGFEISPVDEAVEKIHAELLTLFALKQHEWV